MRKRGGTTKRTIAVERAPTEWPRSTARMPTKKQLRAMEKRRQGVAAAVGAAIPLLAHAMAPLAEALADPSVEDVMVQRENEVWIRRGAATTRHDVTSLSFADIEAIAILAGAVRHQDAGRTQPLLATSCRPASVCRRSCRPASSQAWHR